MNIRLIALLLLLAPFASGQDAPPMKLTVLNPLVRVQLDQPVEGAATAELFAARGETESFQVVVSATDRMLSGVTAEPSALLKSDGASLDAQNVTLYREIFIPVRHSAPRATCPPGLIPDALVPFKNPYNGAEIPEPVWKSEGRVGPRFGATRFSVFAGQNAVVWVDVRVPEETAPGVYEGVLKFTAQDIAPVELPVRLTVWNFVLPPGPTHENHFGGFGYAAKYLKMDAAAPEFQQIEDRYIEMMAAHRINPPTPARLKPPLADDGTPQFSDELTAKWAEFVKRYNVTNIEVPRAPFPDILGADRQKATSFYRGWFGFLDKNGWAKGAYHYMLDEPNEAEAYDQVTKLGALVAESAPALRRLVVEQPYTQDPAWEPLDNAIDIWCPLFGFIDEEAVNAVKSGGDDVWSYTALCQTAPAYHPHYEQVKGWTPPFWQLDFPPISYRIPTWLNYRYHITGLLYWSTVYWSSPERNPWDDPGFRVRWNGEGALFYPGNDAGIDGPVASIRLKNLRDGMEDYEYFKLAEAKADAAAVMAVVVEAVPDWGNPTYNPDKLLELRHSLGTKLDSGG